MFKEFAHSGWIEYWKGRSGNEPRGGSLRVFFKKDSAQYAKRFVLFAEYFSRLIFLLCHSHRRRCLSGNGLG